MANPDLVNYIEEAKAHGDSENKIRDDLDSVGWKPKDIDDAFIALMRKPGMGLPVPEEHKSQKASQKSSEEIISVKSPAEKPENDMKELDKEHEKPAEEADKKDTAEKKPDTGAKEHRKSFHKIITAIVVVLVILAATGLVIKEFLIPAGIGFADSGNSNQSSIIEGSPNTGTEEANLEEKCQFSSGIGTCEDFSVTEDTVMITIRNNMKDNINIFSLQTPRCSREFDDATVAAGDAIQLVIEGCNNGNKGDLVEGMMDIVYSRVATALPIEATGTLRARIE